MGRKLGELLAVEGQLKAQAVKLRGDLHATFSNKRHLFAEVRKVFEPLAEGAEPQVEEESKIQSTVPEELQWLAREWAKAINTSYTVAVGNTTATATVQLEDGTVLLEGVPATALLELQKQMGELQELLGAVPTLDPAKGFVPDGDRGVGYYRAREVRKPRTKKVAKAITLAPATPEHPAQVQLVNVDEPIGMIVEQEWSAMITPARKSQLLSRVEEVRRALKQALHRANAAAEVPGAVNVAEGLFSYVLR